MVSNDFCINTYPTLKFFGKKSVLRVLGLKKAPKVDPFKNVKTKSSSLNIFQQFLLKLITFVNFLNFYFSTKSFEQERKESISISPNPGIKKNRIGSGYFAGSDPSSDP